MTQHDGGAGPRALDPADQLGADEKAQLVYALEGRFAAHLDAAASAVREAERELAEVREQLARAIEEEERARYRSDPLVFMRDGVTEEVEGLVRKTTPKKLRTSYRYLLDRAVELAAGEVQGYHDDRAREQQEREQGVQASRAAEQRAIAALEEAQAMQGRVQSAEAAARRGLDVLADKLEAPTG
ncbi:hypothetical protein [Ornithinicoccus hortensis]|uniref:Uncharacterized protein n=1 Tax=Ornithinicoccus hortensis TaxID=82346 RepID=A0A542YUP9_9MICO|nr:hypothetical protein [Ornithinicoccus hortensis]TQL51812.1 hypothetical protein FB467_2975 [Ornithinicoccus hortensis]